MPIPILEGARAKIQRAEDHLRDINSAISRIRDTEDQFAATTPPAYTYDSEGKQLIILKPATTPVDPTLSLLVGDCIHNARSALDHLVYQLAIMNGTSTDAAEKTSFPAYLAPRKFKNSTETKVVPFIDSAAFAEIEKRQPYSLGNAGDADALWVLSQLDIIDKHRLLIVTSAKVRAVAFTVLSPPEKGSRKIYRTVPGSLLMLAQNC